jgi:hypothetical protein
MYYSAVTTVALFIAIIINDVIQNNISSISNHAFFGLLSVLAVLFLCMKGAESVAWGLIIIPMFTIALSFVLSNSDSDSKYRDNSYYTEPTQTPKAKVPTYTELPKQVTVQLPVSTKPTSSSSNITPAGTTCSIHMP